MVARVSHPDARWVAGAAEDATALGLIPEAYCMLISSELTDGSITALTHSSSSRCRCSTAELAGEEDRRDTWQVTVSRSTDQRPSPRSTTCS